MDCTTRLQKASCWYGIEWKQKLLTGSLKGISKDNKDVLLNCCIHYGCIKHRCLTFPEILAGLGSSRNPVGSYLHLSWYLSENVVTRYGQKPCGGGGSLPSTVRFYVCSIHVSRFSYWCCLPRTNSPNCLKASPSRSEKLGSSMVNIWSDITSRSAQVFVKNLANICQRLNNKPGQQSNRWHAGPSPRRLIRNQTLQTDWIGNNMICPHQTCTS